MDSENHSPLIDLLLRGDADRDMRMLGALGALGLQVHEQLALLRILVTDPDAGVAEQAEATLAALPPAALASYLARADVSAGMREFFAARGVTSADLQPAPDAGDDLAGPPIETPEDEAEADKKPGGSTALLSTLPVIERIKLAANGTRAQRAQLIRDSNRLVATAVLSSSKVNESEVEAFAKMGNVSEDVLRIIGANRTWMKSYGVAHGLIRNPKTPPGISMQLLHRLSERDVKALATDRNVSEVLRLSARRMLARTQK